MELRTLPGSDLKVTPICMGTWQFNDSLIGDKQWEPQKYDTSKAIVDKALECGINFFDTAEAYPNSQDVLGRVLEGRRKNIILATKFGYRGNLVKYTAEDVAESLNISLQSLRTDYIDIFQCHWPVTIENDISGIFAELERQKSLGRIRYYSVSNFGARNLKDILAAGGKPLTNQVCYNLLWRGMEYDIGPLCRDNNISILAYSPLQQGLLTGKFLRSDDVPPGRRRTKHFSANSAPLTSHGESGAEKETFQTVARIQEIAHDAGVPMSKLALSWLLQQPNVASTIVGASRPDQVEDNCKIIKLNQDIVDRLSLASDELKQIFGGAMDLWAPVSRIN